MKTASPALQAHLEAELSTLATMVKLTRKDGVVMGFTSHDRDLVLSGVTYKAQGGFSASALESRQGLSTDNLEIAGVIGADGLAESDLRAGVYDHARLDVYLCNWADLSQGTMQLRRGWIGEVQLKGGQYLAEVRGLHDLLQRPIGSTFTPECRHQLGDARCGLSLAALTVTGSVTLVSDASLFYDSARSEADATFAYGLLTWLSGANAGLSMEVKSFAGQRFTLWLPMPHDIAEGDQYQVTRGCDHRYETCRSVFGNLLNFGGFPHLPGVDRILNYPDARA